MINLSSVSNIKSDENCRGNQNVGVVFGAVTFGVSFCILVVDRWGSSRCINFTQAAKDRLEGATLLLLALWWTVGVAYLTQVGGLAYQALNVYASAWSTWGLCWHTLNQWSATKDILTWRELTSLSETLSAWYALAFSAMVVTGSAVDLWCKTGVPYTDDCIFAFCLGCVSVILAWTWILTHLNLMTCLCSQKEGGWLEAGSAWAVILVSIVNCAVITRDGGIGATVIGTQHDNGSTTLSNEDFFNLFVDDDAAVFTNCTLVWTLDGEQNSAPMDCPSLDQQRIPGSNIYLASWVSLAASFQIALRWNAQRALELAQPTHRRVASSQNNAVSSPTSPRVLPKNPTTTTEAPPFDNDGGDDVDDESFEG